VGQPLAGTSDLLALADDVAAGGADLAHGIDPLLAETERTAQADPVAATNTPAAADRAAAFTGRQAQTEP